MGRRRLILENNTRLFSFYAHNAFMQVVETWVILLSESNPHMGHLAWADAFVITADSVSMLSDACSTG
jgi:mitochondrial fission protein ELM1